MTLPAYVALLLIHLHFPEAGSLKAKRKDLSSVKAQLHGRLGAAVAEVDHQDVWQRATLAAALTSGSLRTLEEAADRVERSRRWTGFRKVPASSERWHPSTRSEG